MKAISRNLHYQSVTYKKVNWSRYISYSDMFPHQLLSQEPVENSDRIVIK